MAGGGGSLHSEPSPTFDPGDTVPPQPAQCHGSGVVIEHSFEPKAGPAFDDDAADAADQYDPLSL
jgi:hypothetical protein